MTAQNETMSERFEVEGLKDGKWHQVDSARDVEQARFLKDDWEKWNREESKSNPYSAYRIVKITTIKEEVK